MASSVDQTVRDFDLDFLDASPVTAEPDKIQNANVQLQAKPPEVESQFGDINKLQVHIPLGKFQKQRRSLVHLKKKTIQTAALLHKFHTKKAEVEACTQQLMASKDECRQISIQYKHSEDQNTNLQTENTKLQNAVKELQAKVFEADCQGEAMKSHCKQLQILAKQNETSIQSLELESNLEKNDAKTHAKKITTLEKEREELMKHIVTLSEVVLGTRKPNKKDRLILAKYKITTDKLETSEDGATSDSDVYEDAHAPASPAYTDTDDKFVSPAMRLVCQNIKESRPAEVDRDSDSGNEVVSEDTGRGSSLASSGSEKCFPSPEYFINTTSIGLINDKQEKPACVHVATSPIAKHSSQRKYTSTQNNTDPVNTKPNNVDVGTSPMITHFNDLCNKSTSPIVFEEQNKSIKSIFDDPNEFESAKSSREVQSREVATSRILPTITVTSEDNVTVNNYLRTNVDEVTVDDCLPNLSSDESDGEELTREDSEIEMILTNMRMSHSLVTPIPTTPRSNRGTRRSESGATNVRSEHLRILCTEFGTLKAGNSVLHTTVSDINKNVSDMGKNMNDMGKNMSDIEKNVTDMGKNMSDIGKEVFNIKNLFIALLKSGKIDNTLKELQLNDEVTDVEDQQNHKNMTSDRDTDIIRLPEENSDCIDAQNTNTQSTESALKIEEPTRINHADLEITITVEEENLCHRPKVLAAHDDLFGDEMLVKDDPCNQPIGLATNRDLFGDDMLEKDDPCNRPMVLAANRDIFGDDMFEKDDPCNRPMVLAANRDLFGDDSCGTIINTPTSKEHEGSNTTNAETDAVFKKPVNPDDIKNNATATQPARRMSQAITFEQEQDEYDATAEDTSEQNKEKHQESPATDNIVTAVTSPTKKAKKLTKLEKMRKKLAPKHKIKQVESPTKRRKKAIVPKKLNDKDSSTLNSKDAYEKAVKIMSELRKTHQEKIIVTDINRVKVGKPKTPEADKVKANFNYIIPTGEPRIVIIPLEIADKIKNVAISDTISESKSIPNNNNNTIYNKSNKTINDSCTINKQNSNLKNDQTIHDNRLNATPIQRDKEHITIIESKTSKRTQINPVPTKTAKKSKNESPESNRSSTRITRNRSAKSKSESCDEKQLEKSEHVDKTTVKKSPRLVTRENRKRSSADIQEQCKQTSVNIQEPCKPSVNIQESCKQSTVTIQESCKQSTVNIQESSKQLTVNIQESCKQSTVNIQEPNRRVLRSSSGTANSDDPIPVGHIEHVRVERMATRTNGRTCNESEKPDGPKLTTYHDMDMFNDTNNDVIDHDVVIPKKKQKVTICSTQGVSKSILIKLIDKFGVIKHKPNPPKRPADTVTTFIKQKLEETIAGIVQLPDNKAAGANAAMNEFVKEIKKWRIKDFTIGLLNYLGDPTRKTELHSKRYIMNSPELTRQEQVLLYLVRHLNNAWPKVNYMNYLLDNIEFTLFRLNATPEFDKIESMGHFYAVLCRYSQSRDRLRIFMLDAMYCLQFKAVPLIRHSLDVWMHVLPLAHLGIAKNPLVTCLVYLLHFYKCEDRYNRVQEIRNILQRKYSYKVTEWNEPQLLEMVRSAVKDQRGIEIEKKLLHRALLLLGKRHGPQWCQKHIVSGVLLPMLDHDVSDKVKEFCISMLGPLLRPYPQHMTVHVEEVITVLTYRLDRSPSPEMQEAIIGSLIYVSRHSFVRVIQALLKWQPAQLSSEMEKLLLSFVREKTIKAWQQTFSKISLAPN